MVVRRKSTLNIRSRIISVSIPSRKELKGLRDPRKSDTWRKVLSMEAPKDKELHWRNSRNLVRANKEVGIYLVRTNIRKSERYQYVPTRKSERDEKVFIYI